MQTKISNETSTALQSSIAFARQFLFLSTLLISGLLSSCMPQTDLKKISPGSNSTNSPTTNNPTSTTTNNTLNYIQDGPNLYTSIINYPLSGTNPLYLRGKIIHEFISLSTGNQQICLGLRLLDSEMQKMVIVAAKAQTFYNFSTQKKEWYYLVNFSDLESNTSLCQKTGVINRINLLYPSLSAIRYSLENLCASGNCSKTFYNSNSLEAFTTSGTIVSSLTLTNLSFKFTNSSTNNSTTPLGCTTNDTCTSIGYSCCSAGQCVKDLQLKEGVNTSSAEYLQALQDILANPNNIYQYPQYYYLCSVNTTQPSTLS